MHELRVRVVLAVVAGLFLGSAFFMARSEPASADFVCPVPPVPGQAVANSNANFITIAGGYTSILPGVAGDPASSPVSVPANATNNNGTGNPGVAGSFSVPGGSNYSAIWNTP